MLNTKNGENLITEEIAKYLSEIKIPIRLACITDAGWPLVTSLWFVFMDDKLYCATQRTAKVIEFLSQNPRCGFEVASDQPPYRGVRGKGRVRLSEEMGPKVLRILMDKYDIKKNSTLGKFLLSNINNEMVIEIEPVKLFTWDYSDRMKDSVAKD
jgi:nitroimidazol reductase NimA-like FMN-containing flavoprotein (pyridoxamine 5'-phosphate oxidase superfamily)